VAVLSKLQPKELVS